MNIKVDNSKPNFEQALGMSQARSSELYMEILLIIDSQPDKFEASEILKQAIKGKDDPVECLIIAFKVGYILAQF